MAIMVHRVLTCCGVWGLVSVVFLFRILLLHTAAFSTRSKHSSYRDRRKTSFSDSILVFLWCSGTRLPCDCSCLWLLNKIYIPDILIHNIFVYSLGWTLQLVNIDLVDRVALFSLFKAAEVNTLITTFYLRMLYATYKYIKVTIVAVSSIDLRYRISRGVWWVIMSQHCRNLLSSLVHSHTNSKIIVNLTRSMLLYMTLSDIHSYGKANTV